MQTRVHRILPWEMGASTSATLIHGVFSNTKVGDKCLSNLNEDRGGVPLFLCWECIKLEVVDTIRFICIDSSPVSGWQVDA